MKIISKIILIFIVICSIGCSVDPIVPVDIDNKIDFVIPKVSAVTQVGAFATTTISGRIDDEILDKGICWSTSNNPTTSSQKKSGGRGSGLLNIDITNLMVGTNYFVRAYVQTQNETLYSQQIQFRTMDYQLASVSTGSITSVTTTGAIGSGNVISSGGGTVTVRGLCWSVNQNPTVSNTRNVSGSGTGVFSSDILSLNAATVYYVRAYATNQAGTAYGSQVSLVTASVKLATVSTLSVSSIMRNSALVTGSVTSDGGGTITSRGICYSTNTNPTIVNNSYNNNGSGIGAVSYSLSGLLNGTTYYVRAYAVNSAGVSYGVQSSFRTL